MTILGRYQQKNKGWIMDIQQGVNKKRGDRY
jgi:hypothetical protein